MLCQWSRAKANATQHRHSPQTLSLWWIKKNISPSPIRMIRLQKASGNKWANVVCLLFGSHQPWETMLAASSVPPCFAAQTYIHTHFRIKSHCWKWWWIRGMLSVIGSSFKAVDNYLIQQQSWLEIEKDIWRPIGHQPMGTSSGHISTISHLLVTRKDNYVNFKLLYHRLDSEHNYY